MKKNFPYNPEEFGKLLRYLQENSFNLVMVDGPRGGGKSMLCSAFQAHSTMTHYKTWGKDQRTMRGLIEPMGLELPQGTYFMLDFVGQVGVPGPVMVDRSTLSAMAYQKGKWREPNILRYYEILLKQANSVILYISTDIDIIVNRRIARAKESQDELFDGKTSAEHARKVIEDDVTAYTESIELLTHTTKIRLDKAFNLGENMVGAYRP